MGSNFPGGGFSEGNIPRTILETAVNKVFFSKFNFKFLFVFRFFST